MEMGLEKKKRILFLLCNNLTLHYTHLNRKILFEQVRRHVRDCGDRGVSVGGVWRK